MPYVKELCISNLVIQPSFRRMKLVSMIIAFVAFGSAFFSSWWMRPLARDGSRYVLQMLNLTLPYYDGIRYSHGLFQFPAIVTAQFFPDLSPLTISRIYFLSLTVIVYGVLFYRISKSQTILDLLIPFSLLIIGYIPGNSFLINSVFETTFFFYLMISSWLKESGKWKFYLFGFISSLGHPSVMLGFLLVASLIYVRERSEEKGISWSKIIFLMSLSLVCVLLFCEMMTFSPRSANGFILIPFAYLSEIVTAKSITTSISLLYLVTLYSNLINGKIKFFLQACLFLMILILISIIPDSSKIHENAYDYRFFTVIIVFSLTLFMWLNQFYRKVHISQLSLCSILIIGACYVYHDLKIGHEFKNVISRLREIRPTSGCHIVEIPQDIQKYITFMDFTVFKIVADNSYNLDYLMFAEIPDRQKICSDVIVRSDHQVIFYLGYGVHMWMSNIGKFKLPEFTRRGI